MGYPVPLIQKSDYSLKPIFSFQEIAEINIKLRWGVGKQYFIELCLSTFKNKDWAGREDGCGWHGSHLQNLFCELIKSQIQDICKRMINRTSFNNMPSHVFISHILGMSWVHKESVWSYNTLPCENIYQTLIRFCFAIEPSCSITDSYVKTELPEDS